MSKSQKSIAKNELQQQILDIASDTMQEVEEVFWGPNSDETIKFVKSLGYEREELPAVRRKILDTKPGHTIILKEQAYIKSQDFKFELVENYIFRLEQATINQINIKNRLETKVENLETELDYIDNLGFLGTITLAFRKLFKNGGFNG